MELTTNDFFCGGGGMGLGFQQAGFKIVQAFDFDKYAVATYRENVGDHVQQADITQQSYRDIKPANVWTFGFPCQDLSIAGKQAGLIEGKRSGLFFEVMRLLDELREREPQRLPAVLLAENVKGLKLYLPVLEAEYAKRGYIMYCQLFNSKYWGVPQNRERYFVVGIRKDLPQTFIFPEEQQEYVPKLVDFLDPVVDEKYYVPQEKAIRIIEQAVKKLERLGHKMSDPVLLHNIYGGFKEAEPRIFTEYAPTLRTPAGGGHMPSVLQVAFTDSNGCARACRTSYANGVSNPDVIQNNRHTLVIENIHGICMDDQGRTKKEPMPQTISPCLRAQDHGNPPKVILDDTYGYDGVRTYEDISPTVRSSRQGLKLLEDYSAYRVRKLTPTEYGRLQAFPMDTWKQVVSDSQAYKQFGNAVTVTVAKANAEAIKAFLKALQ